MLLVSGATATVSRLASPKIGSLLRPGNGNRPVPGVPWAADNGAFSGFDAKAFGAMLARLQGVPGCLWVATPDVVADAAGTDLMFSEWEPQLHSMGFPVAYVAQDGLVAVPWDRCECLFVGGTTRFKMSAATERLAREAKRRGKLLHIGRVNSLRRLSYAQSVGADTVDGTGFSAFPDTRIPLALRWLGRVEAQPALPLDCEHAAGRVAK